MKSVTTWLAMACLAPSPSVQSGAGAPSIVQLQTPASIREEHVELRQVLAQAAAEPGELGAKGRALRDLMEPHFHREEEIATPPLALLRPLAEGGVTPEMRAALSMTRALEQELPQMLEEHRRIGEARQRFEAVARTQKRGEYVEFSEHLAAHARQEEEVLYPAAILVGRYISSQMDPAR